MSVSDRNLIRKMLLKIFREDLILAAGKQLVHYAKYFCSYLKGSVGWAAMKL